MQDDQLRAIVRRMVERGESEDAIAEVVRNYDAMQSQPPPSAPSQPSKAQSVTSALPAIGGFAGSLLGGSRMSPVGMALAGVGGAAGEAYRQVADSVRGDFSDVPETILGRLQRIGTEGAKQAGMEGAGRVVTRAVAPVAKTLYGLALRPSRALMRDAGGGKLLAGARRIVNQGFDDAVMPSGIGTSRAGALVTESTNEATDIAAKSTTPIHLDRVLQKAEDDQVRRMAGEMRTAGVAPNAGNARKQIAAVVKAHTKRGPTPSGPADVVQGPQGFSVAREAAPDDLATVTPSELLSIRRGSEDVAGPVFKAAKLPGGAGRVAPGSEASVARSISGAAKETLDDVLGESFRHVNRRTQARRAVQQAVEEAAARPNMLTNLLAGGAGVASSGGDPMEAARNGLLLRMLFSPSAMGATALAVGKAPYANLFRAADVASQE